MLVRITNMEYLNQTGTLEAIRSGSTLSRPFFGLQLEFKTLEHLQYVIEFKLLIKRATCYGQEIWPRKSNFENYMIFEIYLFAFGINKP